VSHLQKAPRDGTKWRFIPTCAWCRIDTLFIWKICNRHQGTVPQQDFFLCPQQIIQWVWIFYIIEGNKNCLSPVLIIYWQRALGIIEFSLFNIHNNLLSSSKLLMFWEINVIWSLSSALSWVHFTHLKR
jgi:hypothetical protein